MGGESAARTAAAAERQCAVTRIVRPREALIRFVVDPEGRVVPDLKARLPGRGVWVTAAADVVAEAARKGHFARGFQRTVAVAPDLATLVESLLARAALGALALANKAGQVVAGFAQVAEALDRGRVAGLIHAAEAAEDGKRKLDSKLRGGDPDAPVVGRFTGEELSLALGRPYVVHAAVTGGGAGAGFLTAVARLERFGAGSAAFAAA